MEQTQAQKDAELLATLDSMGISDSFTPVTQPVTSPIADLQRTSEKASIGSVVGDFLTQYAPEIGELGGDLAAARIALSNMSKAPKNPAAQIAVGGGSMLAYELGLPMFGRAVGETVQDFVEGRVDPMDTINGALEAGAFGALGAGAGQIIGGAKDAITSLRLGKQPTPEQLQHLSELNTALLNSGIKIGDTDIPVHLTPAQMTGSPFMATLEKISMAGFGGGRIFDIYKAQDEALRKIYDQNVTMYDALRRNSDGTVRGVADKETGQIFQESLEQARGEFIAFSEKQWQNLDEVAKGTKLNTTGVENYVRAVLKEAGVDLIPNRGLTGSKQDLQKMATRLGNENLAVFEKTLKGLLDNERSVSFHAAFTDIRNMRDLAYKASKEGDNSLAYALNRLRDKYEAVLNSQSTKVGTDVWKRFQNLSEMYSKGMEGFNRSKIEVGLEVAPEFVGEQLLKEGNVTSVEAAFEAIKHSSGISNLFGKGLSTSAEETTKRMKAGYLDALYERIQTAKPDKGIQAAVQAFTDLTRKSKANRTFNAVFSPKEQANILKGLEYASSFERQSGGNISLAVRGQQAANVRKILANENSALGNTWSAFIAAGPAMFGRWMLEESGEKQIRKLIQLNKKLLDDPVKFNKRDQMALFSIMASAPFRHDELPPEWQDMKEDPRDVILTKKLESLGL